MQSELHELRQELQGAHSSAEQHEQTQEALRQEVSQWEQAHKEALEKLATSQASLAEVYHCPCPITFVCFMCKSCRKGDSRQSCKSLALHQL